MTEELRKLERQSLNAIDKAINKLPFVYAKFEIQLKDKLLTCEYTKSNPIGFSHKYGDSK